MNGSKGKQYWRQISEKGNSNWEMVESEQECDSDNEKPGMDLRDREEEELTMFWLTQGTGMGGGEDNGVKRKKEYELSR